MVRIWGLLRAVKVPAYNQQLRVLGLDPSTADSMTVGVWPLAADPFTDPPSWLWNSWYVTEAQRDDLVALMESLGPANVPGPQCQAAYYMDDEPDGWTNAAVLADLTRKPDQLKVEPLE